LQNQGKKTFITWVKFNIEKNIELKSGSQKNRKR
jgi:hypothetical protein